MDDGPRPERPYDELLARVVRRGAGIRRRRQALAAGSTALVVALLIATPLVLGNDDPDRRVETVAGPGGDEPDTPTPTTDAVAVTTTTVVAEAGATPTSGPAPTTTVPRRPTVTTTGPVPATTVPPPDPCAPSAGRGRIALVRDNALHVVNPDGSCLQRRAPDGAFDQDPAWSPDGSKLAFARAANITVMDADGDNVRQLTTSGADRGPAWSPDGRRIAFVRQDGSGIWVMGTDGSGPSVVYDPPDAIPLEVSWSPDGSRLTFSGTSPGIWVVGANGAGPVKVNAGGNSPAWGPDGRIAFAAASGSDVSALFLMDASFAGMVPLGLGSSRNDARPAWSADGGSLAFESFRAGEWAVYAVAVGIWKPALVAPGIYAAW